MDTLPAALFGAAVGGTLSLCGSWLVMRSEQAHRATARVLLELLPVTLERLRQARTTEELSRDQRVELRDVTTQLVIALALGGRRERAEARRLQEALPDFSGPAWNDDASVDEKAEALSSILFPSRMVRAAEEVIRDIRERRLDQLARSPWERLRRTV